MDNNLLIVMFETGDNEVPRWQLNCVLNGGIQIEELEDSFTAFLETSESEDLEFEEITETVLSKSGLESFEIGVSEIPVCKNIYTLWL